MSVPCPGCSLRRDKTPAALFFHYNTQLGPPYNVIIDTNFINFSIRNKAGLAKTVLVCNVHSALQCALCDKERHTPRHRAFFLGIHSW